jgi:hypothetical protein
MKRTLVTSKCSVTLLSIEISATATVGKLDAIVSRCFVWIFGPFFLFFLQGSTLFASVRCAFASARSS